MKKCPSCEYKIPEFVKHIPSTEWRDEFSKTQEEVCIIYKNRGECPRIKQFNRRQRYGKVSV